MFVFDWFKKRRMYAAFEAALSKGDPEGAIKALDEIIRAEPQSLRPHLEKAQLYHYDDPRKAVESYNRAIEIDPKSVEALFGRGHSYYGLVQYEQAIEDFSAAIQIDSKHQMSYRNRGSSYSQLQMLDKAFADYEKALELDPNDGLTYECRAWAKLRSGQQREAITDFTKAMSIDERLLASCLDGRADAYAQIGEIELANHDRKRAKEMNLESGDDSRHLRSELLTREQRDNELLSLKIFKKCKFEEPREVDHNFVVPLERKDELIAKLIEIGISIKSENIETTDNGYLNLQGQDQIALKDIRQRTDQLVRLVFDLRAHYDGWGTMIPQPCDEASPK